VRDAFTKARNYQAKWDEYDAKKKAYDGEGDIDAEAGGGRRQGDRAAQPAGS